MEFELASITIHDVDEQLKHRLQERATRHGNSIEAEARDILREALDDWEVSPLPQNLYAAIRNAVEPFGGIELEASPRQPVREPPHFE